jgi:hypothetical protein
MSREISCSRQSQADLLIDYGNFFANIILDSPIGHVFSVTANHNGLTMSYCCFNGDRDTIAAFGELERPFSLSHCFFSSQFPNPNIFTIVTKCYENIATASFLMQAPTQDLIKCIPPCTTRSALSAAAV